MEFGFYPEFRMGAQLTFMTDLAFFLDFIVTSRSINYVMHCRSLLYDCSLQMFLCNVMQ